MKPRLGFQPEGGSEALQIGVKKTDVAAHDAKMRDLLSFHPEINCLGANPEEFGRLWDSPRLLAGGFGEVFFVRENGGGRKWRSALHRDDLVLLRRHQFQRRFSFCMGNSNRKVRTIAHAMRQILLSALWNRKPPFLESRTGYVGPLPVYAST